MLIDGRSVAPDQQFPVTVCVVGSGPAGIAVAQSLCAEGVSVALVESGGMDPELATQLLYKGRNVGHPYFGLDGCRYRMFGGTSNRWGGWCRPLDPFDYEKRDWVPNSGWPITEQDVRPYYAEAARLLELSGADFDAPAWQDRLGPSYAWEGSDFENAIFQYSPQTNFAEVHGPALLAAPNVTIFLHANVTDLLLDAGTDRIGTVVVRALGREPFYLKPQVVVLAAGGLENARLLLTARSQRPAGLGNEHDVVGRYFQEHVHVPGGHLVVKDPSKAAGFYSETVTGSGTARGVIAASPQAQAEHKMVACSISVEQSSFYYGTPFLGWPARVYLPPVRMYRQLGRSSAARWGERARRRVDDTFYRTLFWKTKQVALEAAGRHGVAVDDTVRSLYFRAEQVPDPASRVALDERRDALGIQRITLDWRVNATDLDAVTGWVARLSSTVRERGIGEVIPPADGWEKKVIGGPHHLGTTRMSDTPATGVVDRNCRVHSVDNLYVAGSSVFTTGGYANPTFTLVALALRLAKHVAADLRPATVVGRP